MELSLQFAPSYQEGVRGEVRLPSGLELLARPAPQWAVIRDAAVPACRGPLVDLRPHADPEPRPRFVLSAGRVHRAVCRRGHRQPRGGHAGGNRGGRRPRRDNGARVPSKAAASRGAPAGPAHVRLSAHRGRRVVVDLGRRAAVTSETGHAGRVRAPGTARVPLVSPLPHRGRRAGRTGSRRGAGRWRPGRTAPRGAPAPRAAG